MLPTLAGSTFPEPYASTSRVQLLFLCLHSKRWHMTRDKSLVSLLKLFFFLSPHLYRMNYFPAICVFFEPPSCKDGGSATGRNQWDKVGLLAMTAVFVYFFVCMPYDLVSRLQLHRQRAKNHHKAAVLFLQGLRARLWWSKVRLYGLSGILYLVHYQHDILYYSYYIPIGTLSVSAQQWAVVSSYFMVCVSYMLSL